MIYKHALAFLLFRPDELDRAGCFSVKVVASGEVAINRDVAANLAAGDEEGLHDECALIVNFAQSAENLRPRHPAASGRTTIGFAQVEMTQPGPCLDDGATDAVFLDVHVEGV